MEETFYRSIRQKLDANCQPHENGQCVIWTGYVGKNGYGQFRYKDPRDAPNANHRTRTSHRVALMLRCRNFDVPASRQASHLCNNKLCLNVEHLVFEGNSNNNLRKTCFSQSRCCGHFDIDGQRLPDCLV
jgi:hypothetical protein